MNAHLENLIGANSFTLIDFLATWCEPCKWVEPMVAEIGKHFGEKLNIQKVDIDEHPDIARELHILSVPTLVLFKGGEEVWRIRGFDTLPKMMNAIEKHVLTAS